VQTAETPLRASTQAHGDARFEREKEAPISRRGKMRARWLHEEKRRGAQAQAPTSYCFIKRTSSYGPATTMSMPRTGPCRS